MLIVRGLDANNLRDFSDRVSTVALLESTPENIYPQIRRLSRMFGPTGLVTSKFGILTDIRAMVVFG